jgi:hypothetical protein
MHLRKSFQCLKRQRHGFLRQLINYFDAKEQDTPKAGTGQDASATPNVGLAGEGVKSIGSITPLAACADDFRCTPNKQTFS